MVSRTPLRRSLAAVATLVVLGSLAGCGGDSDSATDAGASPGSSTSASGGSSSDREAPEGAPDCTYTAAGPASKEVDLPPEQAVITGAAEGTIETSIGTLDITLDGQSAPCTVNSFVSLADQGYFDDTSCHRLTTGAGLLVLQCGDPSGTGGGGPGYAFDDELSGEETYPAGTLAMANAGPGTNGSQFFIVYADSQLPPSYTVFGSVSDDSVALVAEAAEAGTDNSNGEGDGAPVTPVDITSVSVEG